MPAQSLQFATMAGHTPANPNWEVVVREGFARQAVMAFLGARTGRLAPGEAEIVLPFRPELGQQNGLLHAGIVAAIADSACGGAALSLMPPGSNVLSIEFKLNLLVPAAGDHFSARARVIRAGRTVTVCAADVFAISGTSEVLVATMLGTMMRRATEAS